MKRLLLTLSILSLVAAAGVWWWITSPRFSYDDNAPRTPPAQQARELLRFWLPALKDGDIRFQRAERRNERLVVTGVTLRLPPPLGFAITIDRIEHETGGSMFNGRFVCRGLRLPVRKLPLGAAFVLMQGGYLKDLVFDIDGRQFLDPGRRLYRLWLRIVLRGDARVDAFAELTGIDAAALQSALHGDLGGLLQARLVTARTVIADTRFIDKLLRLAIGQNRDSLARRIGEHITLLDDPTAIRAWRAVQVLLRKRLPLVARLRPPVPQPLQRLLDTALHAWERLPGLRVGNLIP